MEDVLPKELIAIVGRYLFDHYYSQVKSEYNWRWLSGADKEGYTWNDGLQCFAMTGMQTVYCAMLVNGRNLPCEFPYSMFSIYEFYTHLTTGDLPKNYYYRNK